MSLIRIINEFVDLFYPRLCASCGTRLVRNEDFFCTRCLYELPRTHFSSDPDNEVARIFWGRVPVECATAYLFFKKGGHVQEMIHKLKYKGQKRIGFELGKMMGRELLHTPFCEVDMIIPVPLHKRRKRKRGYNQSEYISLGISSILHKQVETRVLFRSIANPSQTRKNRLERWENVKEIFSVKYPELIVHKHVLLVDDIVTTGATLEACASALLGAGNVKVSIATVAKA